jgi:rubrerythrin
VRPAARARKKPSPTKEPRDEQAAQGQRDRKNLKEAFAGESQANRRYLYFARKADVEGYPEVAGMFRDVAEARPATRSATSSTSRRSVTR